MRSNSLEFLKMKLLSSFLIGIFLTAFVAANSVIPVLKSYQGSAPTIDGMIDASEREGTGRPFKITLGRDPWDSYMEPDIINLKVGSSHSNDSYLYINTIINFKRIIFGNITYQFQRDISNSYYDLKRVSSITNSCIDGYRQEAGALWKINKDLDNGGTQDSEGKCVITETYIMFELRMPFFTGDTLGHDTSMTVGETIIISFEFSFLYNKTNDETMYGNYFDQGYSFVLQNTTAAPLSLVGIVLGLVLVIGISAGRRRKKI